jgi:flagellar basal body-associated protein FliL
MTSLAPQARKKLHGRILIIAVILAAAGAVYVVYRNNTEIFARKPAPPAHDVREQGAPPPVESRPPAALVPQGRNRPVRDTAAPRLAAAEVSRPDTNTVSMPPKLRQSVVIPGIDCAILDKSNVHVLLSLELFFENDGMRDEILAKRDQLKVMVRKVFSTKRFDEIQVEPLRTELRNAMNRMLSNGALTDIEFRAFRIQ